MDLRGRALLAPLSTFTNLPFRLLCQNHGAQGSVVPLVSAKAIIMRGLPAADLDPHPSEKFLGVQLFGANPEDLGKAAKIVADAHGYVSYIDINCACPVKKVTRAGAGSALMHRPETAAEIVEAAGKAGLPVTVKIRKMEEPENALEFCKSVVRAGASAIFVHGRVPSQGYSGTADWGFVKSVAETVDVPVIGSGDIRSMEAGRQRLAESGCAAFMIGRAAMRDPAVFESPADEPASRKRALFLEYLALCEKHNRVYFPDLKSKAMQIFTGFHGCAGVRGAVGRCKGMEELMAHVDALQ